MITSALLHFLGCLVNAVTFLLSLTWLSASLISAAIRACNQDWKSQEQLLCPAIRESRRESNCDDRKNCESNCDDSAGRKRDCDDITTRKSDRNDTATCEGNRDDTATREGDRSDTVTCENDHNDTVTCDSVSNDLPGRKSNWEDTTNYASNHEDREVATQLLRRWLQLSSFDKKTWQSTLKICFQILKASLSQPSSSFSWVGRKWLKIDENQYG